MMGKKYKGFSLIEILVVVALIVILATITIVAINPAKNFRDTRNAQRSADIMQILNAVTQYTSEQGHTLGQLGTIAVCPEVTELGTGAGQLNLGDDPEATPAIDGPLVDEYIVAIPEDPTTGQFYTICQTGTGRIEVSAKAEGKPVITVKR